MTLFNSRLLIYVSLFISVALLLILVVLLIVRCVKFAFARKKRKKRVHWTQKLKFSIPAPLDTDVILYRPSLRREQRATQLRISLPGDPNLSPFLHPQLFAGLHPNCTRILQRVFRVEFLSRVLHSVDRDPILSDVKAQGGSAIEKLCGVFRKCLLGFYVEYPIIDGIVRFLKGENIRGHGEYLALRSPTCSGKTTAVLVAARKLKRPLVSISAGPDRRDQDGFLLQHMHTCVVELGRGMQLSGSIVHDIDDADAEEEEEPQSACYVNLRPFLEALKICALLVLLEAFVFQFRQEEYDMQKMLLEQRSQREEILRLRRHSEGQAGQRTLNGTPLRRHFGLDEFANAEPESWKRQLYENVLEPLMKEAAPRDRQSLRQLLKSAISRVCDGFEMDPSVRSDGLPNRLLRPYHAILKLAGEIEKFLCVQFSIRGKHYVVLVDDCQHLSEQDGVQLNTSFLQVGPFPLRCDAEGFRRYIANSFLFPWERVKFCFNSTISNLSARNSYRSNWSHFQFREDETLEAANTALFAGYVLSHILVDGGKVVRLAQRLAGPPVVYSSFCFDLVSSIEKASRTTRVAEDTFDDVIETVLESAVKYAMNGVKKWFVSQKLPGTWTYESSNKVAELTAICNWFREYPLESRECVLDQVRLLGTETSSTLRGTTLGVVFTKEQLGDEDLCALVDIAKLMRIPVVKESDGKLFIHRPHLGIVCDIIGEFEDSSPVEERFGIPESRLLEIARLRETRQPVVMETAKIRDFRWDWDQPISWIIEGVESRFDARLFYSLWDPFIQDTEVAFPTFPIKFSEEDMVPDVLPDVDQVQGFFDALGTSRVPEYDPVTWDFVCLLFLKLGLSELGAIKHPDVPRDWIAHWKVVKVLLDQKKNHEISFTTVKEKMISVQHSTDMMLIPRVDDSIVVEEGQLSVRPEVLRRFDGRIDVTDLLDVFHHLPTRSVRWILENPAQRSLVPDLNPRERTAIVVHACMVEQPSDRATLVEGSRFHPDEAQGGQTGMGRHREHKMLNSLRNRTVRWASVGWGPSMVDSEHFVMLYARCKSLRFPHNAEDPTQPTLEDEKWLREQLCIPIRLFPWGSDVIFESFDTIAGQTGKRLGSGHEGTVAEGQPVQFALPVFVGGGEEEEEEGELHRSLLGSCVAETSSAVKEYSLVRDHPDYGIPFRRRFSPELPLMKRYYESRNDSLRNRIREAKILKAMSHPNIVTFRGCSSYFSEESGHLVIRHRMERLRGATLDSYSHTPSALDCLRIALQIAEGLEYLHLMGLFHGDLLPKNIVFRDKKNRVPVLVDFAHCDPELSEETVREGQLGDLKLFSFSIFKHLMSGVVSGKELLLPVFKRFRDSKSIEQVVDILESAIADLHKDE